MRVLLTVVLVIGIILVLIIRSSNEKTVVFMVTTTTQDSGLLSILIPELKKDTGLDIQTIAYGTGNVLRSAAEGNADVILVHDPENEIKFMDQGFGSKRIPIMYNNFVIVGPEEDPANIKNSTQAGDAFKKIHESKALFVSRADESGTHNAEKRVWASIGIFPDRDTPENYLMTGTGMGRTLNVAVEKSAYALTDSATWITYENKGNNKILFSGDDLLQNPYHLITVNAEIHPHILVENQELIVEWFNSDRARKLIENFKASNQQLYVPISSQ